MTDASDTRPRRATAPSSSASPSSTCSRASSSSCVEAGLPVSLTENLDAMDAVKHIPLEDREAFKYALAATLVKNNAHWRAVRDRVRGVLLAAGPQVRDRRRRQRRAVRPRSTSSRPATAKARARARASGGGGGEPLTPEELAELLYQALLKGDDALLRAIARQAVKRFAGMEPGRPVGGTYYLYRTLRNLDLDGVLERLMDQAREQAQHDRRAAQPARGAPRARRVRESASTS